MAACAKSLQSPHTRHQHLPSGAFAAKAQQLLTIDANAATGGGGGNGAGPAFLVVTTGDGEEAGETAAAALPRVVGATLRIHGVGAKNKREQHQRLRGVVGGGGSMLLQGVGIGEGNEEDGLAAFAPTPECAAASQSVSHLYAHGRIPHCTLLVLMPVLVHTLTRVFP